MECNRDTSGSTGQLSSSGSTAGGMHHSHSTPAGVDGGNRTPPATPKKGGKMLAIRVQMLDDTVTIFQVQAKALGRVLFDQVCKQLHLLEADYFGLEYADMGTKYWLDLQKPISRQLGLSLVDPLLYFCVKFYTPDPGQLEEEYTRYLFCLQVKRDLAQGLMLCNDNTAALMASYIVQAECGDYVPEDYPDHTYLSSYKFVPHQDHEMEKRIMENHKKHAGQSPAEADLNLLETARRCELYGIKMHPAKDHENVSLNLAVAHMGILVFQHYTKINTFSWAKIRKISFKRKRFLIKLHPEGYGYYKDTVEFFFEGRNECKNFWKKCVENHGFFRCSSVKNVSRHKTRVLSRGSSFRYSGKTQKQIIEFVRDNYVKRQTFQRSASFRHSSAHSSATNMHTSSVGNSISAHPLLPLADSNLSVEASKLSASLGSMGVAVVRPGSPTMKSASHHRDTAMSWSSAQDTRPTTLLAQTTNSPSPPLTTQSASPVTSATTSPHHIPHEDQKQPYANSSPVAVHAAVHRADTGTTNIIRTHTTVVRTPSSHKSEGRLDQQLPQFTNNYPTQTQSQNDLLPSGNQTSSPTSPEYTYKSVTSLPKRHIWQRSASCRELYDFSFEDSGQAKHRVKHTKPKVENVISLEERKLESPITRYDDHRSLYSTSRDTSLEIHQDIMVPDQKVYSSSYPGTTSYSQESVEDPGNYDLRDSQDDLSHDSYEIIERSDDDTSGDYKYCTRKIPLNTRSCSLDSGNYLPSDSDSETEKRHKSKSSIDVHQDIFEMDDPRYFPREIIPRKSDGSFYKAFKSGSRTSSLESKSDYYDSKVIKSSRESLKKTSKDSFGSRTSSQESKSDNEYKKIIRKNKSAEHIDYADSRTSSLDSKSEYYDAASKSIEEPRFTKYHHEYDRKIHFERNYGTHIVKHDDIHKNVNDFDSFPSFKETSHVHSISLQNVETEQNIKANRLMNLEQNTVPRMQKCSQFKSQTSFDRDRKSQTTHIWPESIAGIPTEIRDWPPKQTQRSTESESNIFSFDEDKISSLQESDVDGFGIVPEVDIKNEGKKDQFRDVFVEIEPRKLDKGRDLQLHQPIERTKSDPNSLARQRLNSSSRRLLLMHQKSIDLTPAESSDEDYLYRVPPSAPPITNTKYKGTRFEIPDAEFGHFDILKREFEGHKQKFEVPKSQFELLGAKTQSDLINLPPKSEVDIPYILHKRHIMNGTAGEVQEINENNKLVDELKMKQKKPKSPVTAEPPSSFLFTQNIDLSKVDPVTLEIDKSVAPVQHLSSPKRDITKIDPALLETLNSKLSQIESDSPTSSKTESLKPNQKVKLLQKVDEVKSKIDQSVQKIETDKKVSPEKSDAKIGKTGAKEKIKTETKPKRVIKPRMQPGKKGGKVNKTKVRITSFSSDDESLDSDDVFGSAEATPTKLEFSPPQMRKEMESILKFESERKYLQYTMSSTEVEGSPPQTRKKTDKHQDLEPTQTELRRISERSFSIPSSEDDLNIKTTDMQPVFAEPPDKDDLDKSIDETSREQITVEEIIKEPKFVDDEMEREKLLLQSEIENDLKDLKVPPKTKITEITSPSLRKKGQSPLLFAHARLNLSEGSAFTLLQKQQALQSPIAGRRAKSLDAAVIPVSRLPPLNAFSSKDDTVDEDFDRGELSIKKLKDSGKETVTSEEENTEPIQEKAEEKIEAKPKEKQAEIKLAEEAKKPKIEKPKPDGRFKEKRKAGENDQIVPDVTTKSKKSTRSTVPSKSSVRGKTPQRTHLTKPTGKLQKNQPSDKTTTTTTTTRKSPLQKSPAKPPKESVSSEDKQKVEKEDKQKTLPSQSSLPLPEIKRTKSQEIEGTKRNAPKEKAKSLEKLEFKRMGSKERTKSQDESDTDIAKRKEKQQMLYETAIKQTKTIKSPVKDALPVFPQVEEMVRERHGKLEISINTIENTAISLEEAIIITKSPKKLDKKLTKSLELNLTDEPEKNSVQRLGKSLDLDNRPKIEDVEFDFKQETVDAMTKTSPESDDQIMQEMIEGEVHSGTDTDKTLQDSDLGHDNIILEGTSLDVWLSVDDKPKKLDKIEVINKSNDFFEEATTAKPPDLAKLETKSSSDSQSMERMSLGNSLDIKYIDDSGDSSHKSDKDATLIAEMQKASDTVGRLLRRKLEKRKAQKEVPSDDIDMAVVRITSEDESLTEVSELKCEGQETDANLLAVQDRQHKDSLLKLSIERSRSEDTGSWMTVECDEYIGAEGSFELDNVQLESPGKNSVDENKELIAADENERIEEKQDNLLKTEKHSKIDLLKRSSDQSRSSDTTGSWTSGEKDLSPGNVKETADESSVSCSIGHAIGLSQPEMFGIRDQVDKSSPELEAPRSPRSPRICILGRAFTIDEESGKDKSDESSVEEIPKDESNGIKYKRKPYPFEEKWSHDSELGLRLQQKITKKLSSGEKNSLSSLDESYSEKRRNDKSDSLSKPSLHSFDKLSTESRNSVDTESSSGSLGVAVRMQKSGDIPKELSSTWKPFPLDSSGSSSFEEGVQDLENQEYFLSRENSGDFAALSDVHYKAGDDDATPTRDDTQIPEDLAHFPTNFNYPCLTADIGGISLTLGASDMLGYGTGFLSRTLSRISERSTNSEKSSVEDDSTKASTQSDSLNDESMASSDKQASLSSDTPSNAHVSDSDKKTPTNGVVQNSKPSDRQIAEPLPHLSSLLQRQISDDRRTSAEMAELSMDDIEIITSERGLKLQRQGSDDTIIDEEEGFEPEKMRSSSQESEEWPLPEIPQQKPLMAMHSMPSSDTSQQTTQVFQPPNKAIPKTFGLRGSLKSQDSEQWPSPPSSVLEPPIVGNVETYYMTPPEEACKVVVDSSTVSTYDNDSDSDNDNKTSELEGDKTHTYENVATEHGSESISESLSVGVSGVKIVLETKSGESPGSNSEEDLNISNLNDDVFTDTIDTSKNELRPPTVLRRSTTSDDSSHSGNKKELKPPSHKGSHSSYSDEECTSSMGTNLEDGTVRYALKPTKCTHSSHSEDTSIALSLSEWSNSTNTVVKFQNLSSNSGTTKSSTNTSGLKSDDNSLTDIAQSISEWSSSNSNTLKAQQSSSLQFQKLSSTTTSTGDSTLTDLIPTISEWSSSDTSKTLVPQQFFSAGLTERQSIKRLGSSVDDSDLALISEQKSPQNIPSEDLLLLSGTTNKQYTTKSTERPIMIPVQVLSDTEKSTESSSVEQRTVHTQRYDKEKQRYSQKHQTCSKSTERPVKVPLKLSKCSPYYSSSLSSESTPMAGTSPVPPLSKTATVPLTRSHRKPVSKSLFQAKSPPSENDSTSSMESPKSKSDRERRGYRRRRQAQNQKRHNKQEKEHFYVERDPDITEYNEYIRNRNMEELAAAFHYENVLSQDNPVLQYSETLEEGYFPDGDSQSGSDIFRMEREEESDGKYEIVEGFDVSSIPPPLLEDDFETDKPSHI